MKKPSEKYIMIEKMFDGMLKHALKEHVHDIANDYPSPEELRGKYEYSAKYKKWVADISVNRNKNNRKFQWKTIKRRLINVAAVVIVMFAVLIMIAATVAPFRIAILNYLIEDQEGFYTVDFQTEHEETIPFSIIDPAVDSSLSLPFIPEGYIIASVFDNEAQASITYRNHTDKYITYERFNGKTTMTFDSERFEYEQFSINGKIFSLFSDDEIYYYIYNDENFSYYIVSNIKRDEFIKIISHLLS